MKRLITLIMIAGFALSVAAAASAQTILPGDTRQWFKADLHTHHTYAEPIENIISRYRETGYQFLVLSLKDNSRAISIDRFSTPEMLVIPGVEQSFLTRLNKLGHIIAFPIKLPYPMTSMWTLKEGYAKMRAKNKSVILGVNHPHDQRWSLDDVLEADREGVHLFELNSSDMKHGEFEISLWDKSLTQGAHFYATLTNDVHQIDDIDAYGYILISGESLTVDNMLSAINAGDFYAVESGCTARPIRYEIVKKSSRRTLEVSVTGARTLRIVSDGGSTLASLDGGRASMDVPNGARYVRVEAVDSLGRYVFLQPFFAEDLK